MFQLKLLSVVCLYIYIINTLLQFVVETARLKESIEDSKGDQIQRLILGLNSAT